MIRWRPLARSPPKPRCNLLHHYPVVLVSSAVGSMNYRQSLVLRDRVEAWPMVLIEFGFRFLDVAGDTEELEK